MSLFGLSVNLTNVGIFPAPPNNELIDPITGETVTGNEGEVFIVAQPPIGSVVQGGADLNFEICLTIDPDAPVNTPINVGVTPVYEFGDTATGANGPITGSSVDYDVTPILAEFIKSQSSPEGERPTGPTWPVSYTLTTNVAPNNTIDNIVINDSLPPGFILDVGSINVTGGVGCAVITNSPLNITCTSVSGTGGGDIVVTYSGYFDDVLDESMCDSTVATNTATFDADFNAAAIPQIIDSVNVDVELVSLQKSASPTSASPGQTVTFNLSGQVTDFGEADNMVVVDTLPDGYTYQNNEMFTVNGSGVAITPNVSVTAGVTTLTFDLTAALAGNFVPGSNFSLSYEASIDQNFTATGQPILASDALTNTAELTYSLTAGATDCTDGSGATVNILPVMIEKSLINPQPFYMAGDDVTYRLTLNVPSGDTNGVVFEDFLPLPVFDATTVSTTFGVDIVTAPSDTLGLVPTSITTDAGTNSVTINWPNISTTSPQVLAVDLTVTISSEPFADNLSLANLLQVTTENTGTVQATDVTPVLILVRSPDLMITKGVLSADQGIIAPLPTVLPVDGDITGVDANDEIIYQITVENTGGAQAFDVLINDPAVTGLTNCSIDSVTDGGGNALAFTGDLVTGISLTNPLASNDDNPAGGGAPFSDDTALVNISCDVFADAEFNTTITNNATVSYAAIAGGPSFPTEADSAQLTTSSPTIEKTILQVLPNVDGVDNTVTIGETIQYQVVITLPEGQGNNAALVDLLDNGLVFDDFDSITPSAGVTSSVGFPAALAGAGTLNTRNGLISFGTVENNNSNNSGAATITVVYTVLVTDTNNNNPGNNRNNQADFNTDTTTVRDNAPTRQVREPLIRVNKVATPNMADAGDTISYTITVSNDGRNTNRLSPAFNVTLEDLLADADLDLVVGTVIASQGTVVTGNTAGDTTIDVDVGTLAINASMTVMFDAVISNAVVSGDTVSNTATVDNYTSLPGGGRVYDDVDGTANVAIDAAVAVKTVLGATSTEQTDGINTRGDVTLVDLTIGEEVTFAITTTLAEGVSPSVIITDNLPNNAAGQMEYVSANLISVGANLTAANPNPPAVPSLPSSVSFDFGQVTNTADGVVNAADQIVIQVTGRVTDIPANAGIEALINNVQVQFNTGLNATAAATIEVVEPVMTIDKTSTTSTADAGDTATFVITVDNLLANNTSANAFDVTVTDNIPTGLTFAGNLTTISGPAPDTFSESGNVVTASWTQYDIGSTTVISFDVTVDNSVNPGQVIQNTAGLSWTSLPGALPLVERSSSDSDAHTITIGEAGLVKTVTATSEPSSGNSVNGAEDDITIGEEVTYQFTVELPEGTTPNAVVIDQLPIGSSILSVVSSRIVSIGTQLTPTTGAAGDAGIASDTNTDTYDDNVQWTLGDIFNDPDGVSNANDAIVFEVIALVVDEALNQGGANDLVNTATLNFTGGSRSGTALIDLVEPELSITKQTLPAVILADAGDVINYQLTIDHLLASNADAFNVVITDVFPDPGVSWINDGTFSSNCGATVDSSGDPSIEFTINQLALATGSCTIMYQAEVDVAVKPGASYTNNVSMDYDSTPVFVAGATRRSSDASSATFNIGVPSISKTVSSTSLADTGTGEGDMMLDDLAIGELVDYTITITVPEGTSNNASLVDNLPVDTSGGVMEVTNAVVTSIGSNITTTLPGTPVLTNTDADGLNDQVTIDFGNVVNSPDMVVDAGDQIVVTITARVTDDTLNNAIETYTNSAVFTYGNNGNTISDTADVEVVEPNLGLTKSMGAPVNGVVPIQLSLTNTNGSAAAYDLTLTDVLSDAIWDLASISATSIPAGFDFSVVAGPGAGESTVTIESAAGAMPPASSIEPNEVLVFEFSVTLRNDVTLPASIDNTATLTEASSVPGADPGERDYSDIIAMDSLQLSDLDASKADALLIDNGVLGEANPDDTIRYTVEIDNTGQADATSVVFSDAPDANTTLVVGSVTTTQGTVTTGNTAGDGAVVVDIGTITPNSTVTVTFDVTINNPFPVGVSEISNQGLIESSEFPPLNTDDPDTGPVDDPTITPIGAGHDLTVTKDDGGITAMAGDTIIYAINYANIGDQNSTGVVITETVPNTTVFNAASSTAGWSCTNGAPAGTMCTLTIGDLDGGASGTATFAVDVFDPKPAGVTAITNNISIADDGNNGPEDDTGNNSDDDSTPIDAAPDLSLTKTSDGNDVSPGDVLVYTLTYQNIGTQDATGVMITDTVPVNTTFSTTGSTAGWSCADGAPANTMCTISIGAVGAGVAAATVQFAVTIDNPLATGITGVTNSASINDDGNNGADTNPDNNSDGEDNNIVAVPDLTVSKDDGGITVGAGDTIPYLISYSNIGNQEATGVVLSETVPDNTAFNAGASDAWACVPDNNAGSTCTLAVGSVLGGGGNGTATFAVDVVAPKPSGVTMINNTVSIADDGNNGAEDTSNNMGSDNTPVDAAPDLSLTKTSQVSIIDAGGVLIYDLVYENIGTQDATGVFITETVPVNSTFNLANSSAGWSCADGSIAGTSCVLTVGDVSAGTGIQTVQFAINIDDPLPAGVDQIINNASINDDGNNGDDTNTGNNNDGDTTTVGAAPDLLITKVDTEDLVAAGGVIVYQLSYQNIGNQDSTGVVITESVPANTSFNQGNSSAGWSCANNAPAGTTCTFAVVGTVVAGDAPAAVQFAVNVPNPIPAGVDTVINTVSIGDDGNNGDDADTSNNNDDEETTIGAFPDLSVTKTDNDVTSFPGGVIVYTLSYSNAGTQDSTGVIITETVPANTTFSSADSSAGWVCLPSNTAGSSCDFNVGNLNVGDSGSVNFAVMVDDPLAPGVNEIFNAVSITDDGNNGDDFNPDDNTDNENTSVLLDPPVGIKTGRISDSQPNVIEWTFYWFNPNNNRDLPVFIFDPIPASTQYIPGSATCVATGSSTCMVPTYNQVLNQLELNGVLAPDEGAPVDSTVDDLNNEIVITFSTRISTGGSVTIFNQAQANWDEDNDGNPNNDANDGQVPVVTDSPVTPQYGDPTGVRTVLAVPVLSFWSLLLLIALFLSSFWYRSWRVNVK